MSCWVTRVMLVTCHDTWLTALIALCGSLGPGSGSCTMCLRVHNTAVKTTVVHVGNNGYAPMELGAATATAAAAAEGFRGKCYLCGEVGHMQVVTALRQRARGK